MLDTVIAAVLIFVVLLTMVFAIVSTLSLAMSIQHTKQRMKRMRKNNE